MRKEKNHLKFTKYNEWNYFIFGRNFLSTPSQLKTIGSLHGIYLLQDQFGGDNGKKIHDS